ncbi:MAG: hypothetical protein KDH88_12345 [Chromatiales bacterium]|nr:hypothetical protein [Chromatiales bacterium]
MSWIWVGLIGLYCGFLLAVFLWKRRLFVATWREPYLADLPLLLESDDWGPGGEHHAQRFRELAQTLSRYTDSMGRPAVLTADMVLAVPDTRAMREQADGVYRRRFLDTDFPQIHQAFRDAMKAGVLVPQLHGLEHLNGDGLARLAKQGDPRVQPALQEDDWWDWESLDSPLQGHYVDGSALPTTNLEQQRQSDLVDQALTVFQRTFGFPSRSTVAPCYLWDDATESAWAQAGVRYIQTAGYRCTGRAADGRYVQDPPYLVPGQRNSHEQIYLVRNAMYEPVDGRRADACIRSIREAQRQALPAVVSTHRYNYTRAEEEHRESLAGLERILCACNRFSPRLRHCSSPELGAWLEEPGRDLVNPANGSRWPSLAAANTPGHINGWLWRLWYRHAKLRGLVVFSGLIAPLWLLERVTTLLKRPART